MKEYEVNVYFSNDLITTKPKINRVIVTNDYNSIKFNFNFDIEASKYVFKLLSPSGEVALISEIEDNELTIASGYITEEGYYQFEIAAYGDDSRLTNYCIYKFYARKELIESDDIELPEEKITVLDSLINENVKLKEEIEDAISSLSEGEVTTNYENLINLPQINDTTLKGNKSFSDLGIEEITNLEMDDVFKNLF